MTGRVTVMDLAAEAGVSRATVSLVLRQSPRIKEETKGRVRAAIKKLGYVYNTHRHHLRRSSSQMVAMVINDLTNPFYTELAVGIQAALEERGFVTLLSNTAEELPRQQRVVDAMREHGVAGLIIAPANGTKAGLVDELEEAGVPLVLVMRRIPGRNTNLVAPDNALGARMATEYLIELGHRRIAFLGGRSDMVVRRDREAGYRRALHNAGMAIDEALIVDAEITRRGGVGALSKVIGFDEPATAALCYNDVVAFGALAVLNVRGIRPGRNYSVIGFDDVPEAAHTIPALTTVSVQPKEMGRAAAAALLRRVADPSSRPEQEIFAPRLVIRGTTGPVASPAHVGGNG